MRHTNRKHLKEWSRRQLSFILVIALILGCIPENAYGLSLVHAEEQGSVRMENANLMVNDYIGLYVDNAGKFAIGTTGGNPENDRDNNQTLLFAYASRSSSYTTFCIDGIPYRYDGSGVAFNTDTASHTSEQDRNDIHIVQTLSFRRNSATGREDVVEIKYTVTNTADVDRNVGCRIMMDTQVGGNDRAPFRVPGYGAVTTETEFEGEEIPQIWQAFNSLTNPGVIAQGRFFKSEADRPDKVQFANWARLNNISWDMKINKGSGNGDSGVTATWYEKALAPGETREYKTYYGLSELTQDLTGPLILSVYSESELEMVDNRYVPNPFPVNAYIENIGADTMENVRVSLELPEGLSFAEGSRATIDIGEMKTNVIVQKNWQVKAEPSATEQYYKMKVVLDYGSGETKSVTRTVHVPALKQKAVPRALSYTLFSESGQKSLAMYGWQSYITGNVYSGKDYIYQGSILNIAGKADTAGTVNTNGWQLHIDEINEDQEPVEMPDLDADIIKKAGDLESYTESKTFPEDTTVLEKSIYSEKDITFAGTTFAGNGYIMAGGNITCNLNQGSTYNDGKVVMYTKQGDITLNGSEIALDGILYAPNGTVSINANIFRLRGRIIAKHIVMNTSQNYIEGDENDIYYVYDAGAEEKEPEIEKKGFYEKTFLEEEIAQEMSEDNAWTMVCDAGTQDTDWQHVTWNGVRTDDSDIEVTVAVSEDGENYSEGTVVNNGAELSGIHGRYVRVEARLLESSSGVLPRLIDVTVSTEPADLVTNAAPVFNLSKDTYETEAGVPVTVLLGSFDDALGDRSTYEINLNAEDEEQENAVSIVDISPVEKEICIQESGMYYFTVSVTDGEFHSEQIVSVWVKEPGEEENPDIGGEEQEYLLISKIEKIAFNEDFSSLQITGTASAGGHLKNYQLSFGKENGELQVIAEAEQEIQEGILGEIQVEELESGSYVLLLKAEDEYGNSLECQAGFEMNAGQVIPGENQGEGGDSPSTGETGNGTSSEEPVPGEPVKKNFAVNLSYSAADIGTEVQVQVTLPDDVKEETLQIKQGDKVISEGSRKATFTSDKAGVVTITAAGVTEEGETITAEARCTFYNLTDKNPPTAAITSPAIDTVLTEPVDFVGSACDEEGLDHWKLEYRMAGEEEYILLNEGKEPVKDGVLGHLDTTMLMNGQYNVKLTVQDEGGNIRKLENDYVVEGELKVGAMHIGFTDITAQMGGTTVSANRMYDSRNKAKGDFGIGWTLGVQGMEIYESRTPLSEGYALVKGGSLFSTSYQMTETENHDVVVTYGDGTSDRFELTFSPERKALVPISEVTLGYKCVTNQKVKLEIMGDTSAYVSGTELMFYDDSIEDARSYKLTTEDGVEVYIKAGKGVYKMEDRDGNVITVDEDGYHAEDGRSITFTRDKEGRVIKAEDPAGKVTSYAYDAAGDLVSVTDAADRTVTFTYDRKHNLASITDPMGVAVARNEYDDDGRLAATIDADGNRTEYEHDVDGRMEVIADRLGNKTVYVYDDHGNVLSTTDANGKTTKSTYDSYGNVLTKTDAAGNVTAYAYDADGNMTSVTDADGNTLKNTYNSSNQITSMKALGDTEILIDYDEKGHLTGTTDAAGNETAYTYDRKGNVTGITDELGTVMSAKYDKEGNVIESTDSAGNKITSTYDESGNRLTQTVYVVTENGTEERTTHYVYDTAGELVQTVDADGNTTSVERNANGKMSAAVDSKGRRTEYEYDKRGNVTKIIYSDGTTETFEYDAEDRNTKTVGRTGLTTTYVYDKAGNLLKQTDARGNTVSYTYDDNYNLLAATDAAGAVTAYAYDRLNRNISITDDAGNVTSFTYNGLSLQTSTTDARGNVTKYEYDDNGNRTKVIYPDGTDIESRYDERGRTIWQKDAAGRKTEYTYDGNDRLTAVEQPNGAVTTYTYDQKGNLTAVEDANGNVTRYEYDAEGRRTKVILADGSCSTSQYDKQGMLTGTVDYNGVKTTYTYDEQDRILREQTGEEYTAYEYDTCGRLTGLKTKDSEITYSYNRYGELEQKTYENGEAVKYLYDRYGRTCEIQVLAKDKVQTSTKYEYDKMSRLTRVIGRNGEATVYTYDANGNRETATFANGVKLTYTYDDLNRLILQKSVDKNGTVIAQYAYTLGKNGERTKVTETGACGNVETSYGYDRANRLVKETIETGTGKTAYEYSYDKVGNRIAKNENGEKTEYAYNSRNQLVKETSVAGTVTYTYDANGNLLKQSGGTDTIYTYDVYNRLTAYQQGEKKESYTYDAEGVRRSKTTGTDSIYFVSDTSSDLSQTLAETDGKGNVKAEYTRADSLTAQVRAGEVSYYLYDGHGDVRALLNEAGRITDKYRYNAYGELIEQSGDTENHYLYTGEYYDGTSNLYYLRARYMNPATGNFLTMDTYEGSIYDPDTLHKYMYANGNPVTYSDPSGNMYVDIIYEARQNSVYLNIFRNLCPVINNVLIFVAECVITIAIIDFITEKETFIPIMEMDDYINEILVDPVGDNKSGIMIDYETEHTLLILFSKLQHERRDTGLINLTDEEISALARDKSLSKEERHRYVKEEKLRGKRNKQKRENK